MIQVALAEVGGSDYLVAQAKEIPKAFLTLVGKLVPRDVNVAAEVTGLEHWVLEALELEKARG